MFKGNVKIVHDGNAIRRPYSFDDQCRLTVRRDGDLALSSIRLLKSIWMGTPRTYIWDSSAVC